MGLIAWIVLGGIAGWIASIMMGTDEQQGIGMNIVVGVVGAILGGLIVELFGGSGVTGFNAWSLIVAVLGSVMLLAIVRAMRRPRHIGPTI